MVDDDNTKSTSSLFDSLHLFTFCLPSFLPLIYISLSLSLSLSLSFSLSLCPSVSPSFPPHSIFSSNKEIKEGLLLTCQCDAPAGYSTFFFFFFFFLMPYKVNMMHTHTHTHNRSALYEMERKWSLKKKKKAGLVFRDISYLCLQNVKFLTGSNR